LYISPRCGSVATRSSRIASTVAVSSGGSAERSPISPWPSFGQHETIKAPERADLKAVPCPSPGSIMSSMPWMEGAPGVRITDLGISTFAHTSAGIFPLFSGLGGQIGGARLKHNGPLTAGRRRANDRCRRILVIAGRSGEGLLTEPTTAAQPWQREPLLMPLFGHWPSAPVRLSWVKPAALRKG
jgi:hypothetical protein